MPCGMILEPQGDKEPFIVLFCREGEVEKLITSKSAMLDQGIMKYEYVEIRTVSESEYQSIQRKIGDSFAARWGGMIGLIFMIIVAFFTVVGIRSAILFFWG